MSSLNLSTPLCATAAAVLTISTTTHVAPTSTLPERPMSAQEPVLLKLVSTAWVNQTQPPFTLSPFT